MSGLGRHVVIAGAGLVGALLAVYLGRAGYRVTLMERRADPRRAGYAGGRSINLALSARGFDGLAGVGLDSVVRERDAIPMRGRMIHPLTADGAPAPLVLQPYSSNPDDAINSVSRGGLNMTLLDAAEATPGVTIRFQQRCTDADLAEPAGLFVGPGGETSRVSGDLLVGADGAYSAVRLRMMQNDRFEYSQSYLKHGYKELHIPPRGGRPSGSTLEDAQMDTSALHIWPSRGTPDNAAMMIALPNRDGSFTCTLFWPLDGDHGLSSLQDAASVRAYFQRFYPDAVPLMPTLEQDYLSNPTGSLVTVRCFPWQIAGKACLIGDAAHAIVPFYGQGMNCGFEDAKALAAALEAHPGDQTAALEQYQHARKINADAIADMALDNFIEMRDKTARAEFLYAKRVEQTLHRLFPDRCQPQYNLVSFSTVPYAEARRRGRDLERVVQRVVERVPMNAGAPLSAAEFERAVSQAGAAALANVTV